MFGIDIDFENGLVMLCICTIISIINIIIVWSKTKGYTENKNKRWIPIIIFGILTLIGFILLLILGDLTSLGVFEYMLLILMITAIGEEIIMIIRKREITEFEEK
jgi:tryptophan-rich sensory protein